jgi:hypothetical protein
MYGGCLGYLGDMQRYAGNMQGMEGICRECAGNLQGVWRECAWREYGGNMQGICREYAGNTQGII